MAMQHMKYTFGAPPSRVIEADGISTGAEQVLINAVEPAVSLWERLHGTGDPLDEDDHVRNGLRGMNGGDHATTVAALCMAQTGAAVENLRLLMGSLVTLDLLSKRIADFGADSLADALSTNMTLTDLRLHHNLIGRVGACSLAFALRDNTTLVRLDLTGNNIGDVGCQHLAGALHTNATLTMIKLFMCGIADAGVMAIANALRVNKTLARLELFDLGIRDAGADALARSLRDNTTLAHLSIGGNIGQEARLALLREGRDGSNRNPRTIVVS